MSYKKVKARREFTSLVWKDFQEVAKGSEDSKFYTGFPDYPSLVSPNWRTNANPAF